MPQSIKDRAKKFVEDSRSAIEAGNKQSEGLGAELAAKAQMAGSAPAAAGRTQDEVPKPVSKVDKTNGPKKYGDGPGEKRFDVSDMVKPLGSFAKGTPSVPKTGVYQVHEGEKIVPKDSNSSEHTPEEKSHFHRAMSHLHGGALHRHLGIAEDKPIPLEKKEEAAKSDNPHVAAMGRLAVAMHGWKHGKK